MQIVKELKRVEGARLLSFLRRTVFPCSSIDKTFQRRQRLLRFFRRTTKPLNEATNFKQATISIERIIYKEDDSSR